MKAGAAFLYGRRCVVIRSSPGICLAPLAVIEPSPVPVPVPATASSQSTTPRRGADIAKFRDAPISASVSLQEIARSNVRWAPKKSPQLQDPPRLRSQRDELHKLQTGRTNFWLQYGHTRSLPGVIFKKMLGCPSDPIPLQHTTMMSASEATREGSISDEVIRVDSMR